jgi:GH24 family phage-related lysozyme (muramidase)
MKSYYEILYENKGADYIWDIKNDKFYDIKNNELKDENYFKKYFKSILNKIKKFSLFNKKKILSYIFYSMLAFIPLSQLDHVFTDDTIKNEVTSDEEINKEYLKISSIISKFKNPLTLSISNNGLDNIKKHEQLKLNAYTIGDGKITIGYGHAQPANISKFNLDSKISEYEAEQLLKNDIKYFENSIKNIFKQWMENNINIRITQDMYDCLISLAYNMGISSLRQSEFIQELKKGNYTKAGKLIKTLKVSNKFPGLKIRRESESNLFLSYLNEL